MSTTDKQTGRSDGDWSGKHSSLVRVPGTHGVNRTRAAPYTRLRAGPVHRRLHSLGKRGIESTVLLQDRIAQFAVTISCSAPDGLSGVMSLPTAVIRDKQHMKDDNKQTSAPSLPFRPPSPDAHFPQSKTRCRAPGLRRQARRLRSDWLGKSQR